MKKNILSTSQIKKDMDYSLSNNDIKKIMGNNIKIISYSELEKVNDIISFLRQYNNQIVLFFEEEQTQAGVVGHWESIKCINNTIQFFDSYGLAPDQCRDWLSKKQLVKLKEFKPQLNRLFMNASEKGYRVFYNHNRFQSMQNKDVSTCGAHSCTFLLNGNLSQKSQYLNFMNSLKKEYKVEDYDMAVVYYIFINFPSVYH